MFKVDWLQRVQFILLEQWALASSELQSRISIAITELEGRLAFDPINEGESRLEDERVTFCEPLGIRFTVDVDAKVVTVFDAWIYE